MAVTNTKVIVDDPTTRTWHRWFRRTNVHTAEYIIMLWLMGGMLAVLVSQWYSFFGLLAESGFTARALSRSTAISLAALLVLVPAALWMYSRVTGQEAVEPELRASKPRTVFLTIWMVIAVMALVGVIVGISRALVNAVFGFNNDLSDQIVKQIIPGLFAVVTILLGISAVVKRPSRGFVKLAMLVLVTLAVLLALANTIMIFVRKNSGNEPDTKRCTYSMYRDDECTYREYMDDLRGSSSSSSSSSSLRNNILDNLSDN